MHLVTAIYFSVDLPLPKNLKKVEILFCRQDNANLSVVVFNQYLL